MPTAGAAAAAAAAGAPPPMAVGMPVDPSQSIIASTKEQSYYDDLVTLADIDIPAWPFELQDTDLLPQMDEADDAVDMSAPPGLAGAAQAAEAQSLGAVPPPGAPMEPQWVPDMGELAGSPPFPQPGAADMGMLGEPDAQLPREPAPKRASGGTKRKRARQPKKTLSEQELREKRMVAQRAYRQRMGRASQIRQDFEALRTAVQDNQQMLYEMSENLASTLRLGDWPPELLKILPKRPALAGATAAALPAAVPH